jgi:hypothetical protein
VKYNPDTDKQPVKVNPESGTKTEKKIPEGAIKLPMMMMGTVPQLRKP